MKNETEQLEKAKTLLREAMYRFSKLDIDPGENFTGGYYEITGTHAILTDEGWVEAGDFREGMTIKAEVNKPS